MIRDGQMVSYDNRRLLAAQNANLSELKINIVEGDYKKEYPFNISTSDTPTGSHRVFENHTDPTRSSQFPYVPRH